MTTSSHLTKATPHQFSDSVASELLRKSGNLLGSSLLHPEAATVLGGRRTTKIRVVAHLRDEQQVASSFDLSDPSSTSQLGIGITVYDHAGLPHDLDIYISRVGPGRFEYWVVTFGEEVIPARVGRTIVGRGTLSFVTEEGDFQGALLAVQEVQELSVCYGHAQAPQVITLDFGAPLAEGGHGRDGVVLREGSCRVFFSSQDGHGGGRFAYTAPDKHGELWAHYTNGEKRSLGVSARTGS